MELLDAIRSRLTLKMSIPIALILCVSIFSWSLYHIEYQKRFTRDSLVMAADRVCNTVRLGLHYAMMLNARDDIKAIVENYSRLREIREIRIINKNGDVMFSSDHGGKFPRLTKEEAACQVCHRSPADVPLNPPLAERVYADGVEGGERILRLVSPIQNEPGCWDTRACHDHRSDERILGVLDVSFSASDSESLISESVQHTAYLAFIVFAFTFTTLFFLIFVLIKRPINRIIRDAKTLSKGDRPSRDGVEQPDELGQLAKAITQMGGDLIDKNNQIALQKNLYQDLFEGVPCLVTVQDRDFKLLSFNRTFGEKFSARQGDYCYKAYKNRDSRCLSCPVEKTFKTGLSHCTEESGCYKDGSKAHWIVTTAPIYDSAGNIVAAMEMCLDITERKELEKELKVSEKKYCDIFNNIPSSVFVLDQSDFAILDCNKSATSLYGYDRDEFVVMSFLDLFVDDQKELFAQAIRGGRSIDQARHVGKDGREFFVAISASPSESHGRKVYLVTTGDITKRLETEQQLIQASKMATLGEMATGVAHEINQPLSVIQTSVDLIRRRLARDEMPEETLLKRMSDVVVAQIDRATKIIGHMREFGRKSDMSMEEVALNDVLRKSFEFFGQQLALRSIEVVWDLDERLPLVRCEPNRMEQVFINFLSNARDAIEERAAKEADAPKRIVIKTMHNRDFVTVRISDTGVGVPEAMADKIFEPFFTTKQVGKGTGLGLSISYGIVKDHGGAIHVANNEFGGAAFHIRLPVARKA